MKPFKCGVNRGGDICPDVIIAYSDYVVFEYHPGLITMSSLSSSESQ